MPRDVTNGEGLPQVAALLPEGAEMDALLKKEAAHAKAAAAADLRVAAKNKPTISSKKASPNSPIRPPKASIAKASVFLMSTKVRVSPKVRRAWRSLCLFAPRTAP